MQQISDALKIYFITPLDIKYSYRATEYLVYEYARFLHEHGMDINILVTAISGKHTIVPNYNTIKKRYAEIPKRTIERSYATALRGQSLQTYHNLPKDSVIYFPYDLHKYLINIAFKPKGQKYIIGSNCLQFKLGKLILGGHPIQERIVNLATKAAIFWRGSESKNIYFHVINDGQLRYLLKLGVNRKNIFCVPPMVEVDKFKIGSNTSHRLKVLHVGGFDKDSGTIVEIIKRIKITGKLKKFEFYFIGSSRQQEIKELNMLSEQYHNIHLLGRVSETAMIRTLSSMDVMIVPAYETFSKTLIEGIASGNYIITSYRNDAADDFRNLGIKLDITKTGDPSEYVKPLLNLAKKKSKDPAGFNQYKIKNRAIVVKEFDNSVILPKILNMFSEVIEDKLGLN